MRQWRRFNFFEKELVKEEGKGRSEGGSVGKGAHLGIQVRVAGACCGVVCQSQNRT